jgi:hypothetical protein
LASLVLRFFSCIVVNFAFGGAFWHGGSGM